MRIPSNRALEPAFRPPSLFSAQRASGTTSAPNKLLNIFPWHWAQPQKNAGHFPLQCVNLPSNTSLWRPARTSEVKDGHNGAKKQLQAKSNCELLSTNSTRVGPESSPHLPTGLPPIVTHATVCCSEWPRTLKVSCLGHLVSSKTPFSHCTPHVHFRIK